MTEPTDDPNRQAGVFDDEIGLLALLIVFVKHKRLVLGLPILAAAMVVGITLWMDNLYTATTKILPPQQAQAGSSAMLAQLGALANLAGGAANALRSPNDVYVAMLRSRTVANNLVQRFGLLNLYEVDSKHPSDVLKKLAEVTNIVVGKDGIITIEVDDKDPKRAAEIANAYVEELLKLTQVLAVTEASQRRLFFERQFASAKENLAKAEVMARQALLAGGLVKVDDQGRAMVEAIARLRGQITVKEVQIGAMRTFAADRNPDLQLALRELDSLKRELGRLEGINGSNAAQPKETKQGIDSLRLLREVKYHEVIFDLLAKQFELAKIDEARDSAVVQVMDNAVAPDRKSKPKRALIVLLSTVVALLGALLWAFAIESYESARQDARKAAKIQDIKRNLRWS